MPLPFILAMDISMPVSMVQRSHWPHGTVSMHYFGLLSTYFCKSRSVRPEECKIGRKLLGQLFIAILCS